MKTLRQIHLYLGCIFAPLIIYFCLSGVWQVFRYNDVPKEGEVSGLRTVLHELSKPHTNSTLPGNNPKEAKSSFFSLVAAAMGIGIIITALLGIVLALQFSKRVPMVFLCLGLGTFVPILFLFFAK
jgi:hypothetical protein